MTHLGRKLTRTILETLNAKRVRTRTELRGVEDRIRHGLHGTAKLAALSHAQRTLRTRLERIDGAINRFHAGTYGCCPGCSGTIERTRLRKDPLADRCASCAQRAV